VIVGFNRRQCRQQLSLRRWPSYQANAAETVIGRTIAVGAYLHGASGHGVLDLVGKVLEGCLNKHELATDVIFRGKDSRGLIRISFSSASARLSWLASDTRQISKRSSLSLPRLHQVCLQRRRPSEDIKEAELSNRWHLNAVEDDLNGDSDSDPLDN
jgi:hypothetical protein